MDNGGATPIVLRPARASAARPRSTGLNLEAASDELAATSPRPVDAAPRFTREGTTAVAPPDHDSERAARR
jgi:hypothetical protein